LILTLAQPDNPQLDMTNQLEMLSKMESILTQIKDLENGGKFNSVEITMLTESEFSIEKTGRVTD